LEANKPKQQILAPLPARHALDALTRKSRIKSVVLPSVNMVEDTDLIRRGYGAYLGNDRWRINGRVYAREGTPQGRLFPERGDGIVTLTRSELKALITLVKYNGSTELAAQELWYSDDISHQDIETARKTCDLRTKKP